MLIRFDTDNVSRRFLMTIRKISYPHGGDMHGMGGKGPRTTDGGRLDPHDGDCIPLGPRDTPDPGGSVIGGGGNRSVIGG